MSWSTRGSCKAVRQPKQERDSGEGQEKWGTASSQTVVMNKVSGVANPPSPDSPSTWGVRYECVSENAMIQQIVLLVSRFGYQFWSPVTLPVFKKPMNTDAKIIERFTLFDRKRVKPCSLQQPAKVRYLRFDRFGILLATHGRHRFFEEEPYQDIRTSPIELFGYRVGMTRKGKARRWSASVRLTQEQLAIIRQALLGQPRCCSFSSMPLLMYGGVVRQLFALLREVNTVRLRAGLPPLPYSALPPLKRKSLKVFRP